MNGQVSVEAANVVHSNATKRPVIFNNEVWCLWRMVQCMSCHGFVYSNGNPMSQLGSSVHLSVGLTLSRHPRP